MCGIAGIFSYNKINIISDKSDLDSMSEAMSFRGPDHKGNWTSKDLRLMFAHRRLAIIDISNSANQPMIYGNQNSKLVITFNGEIYNFQELKKSLESLGYLFKTNSDTEVLLAMYKEYGDKMTDYLRGMFAFAIWDQNNQKLFLGRDHNGIKPLYYYFDGWRFYFASELKALTSASAVDCEESIEAEALFYLNGYIPEPNTMYKNIYSLEAGHTMVVDHLGPHSPKRFADISSVWNKMYSKTKFSSEFSYKKIFEEIVDSINCHLIADVKVGIFLSSGMDSASIASISDRLGYSPEALTLRFEEYNNSQNDESKLAKDIANKFNLNHHISTITKNDFLSKLDLFFNDMDQPSCDGLNTWLVSCSAKELGWKVALSGLGADEIFGGYSSFKNVPDIQKVARLISLIPFGKFLFRKIISRSTQHPKASSVVDFAHNITSMYFLQRSIFLPNELPNVMGKERSRYALKNLNKNFLNYDNTKLTKNNIHAKISSLECETYLRNQLLRDSDWASMAHSIELRTPFVDYKLLNRVAGFLLKLDNKNKLSLKNALMKTLPEKIINRKKTGFTTPIKKWIMEDENLNTWKGVPSLTVENCSWAKRWAYVVASKKFSNTRITDAT